MWHEWSTLEKLIWLKRRIGGGASWVWRTITGTAPLTLANAVHNAIKTLTQYGLCTQDGTPTPDAPVDIVCNNGAIKVRRPSGMPIAYQMVEWLKPSGTITITGFKTKSTQEIETVFYRERSGSCYLYSSDTATGGTTNTTAYITSGSGNWRWDGKFASINVPTSTQVTSIQNENGVLLNGSRYGVYSDAGDFVSTNDLRLSSYENTTVRIYAMTIREGETVTLDLVPVQRVSDSTYGFYDKVSGNFYTNQDATFEAGDPIPDPVEIYTDGTPEVLTVSGKNLFDPTKVLFGYYRDITTGNQVQSQFNFMSPDGYYIPCLPNTAYTFVGTNKANGTYSKYNTIYYFDSAKNYLGASPYKKSQPATGTTPSNCYYLQIRSNPLDTASVTIQEAFSRFNWQLEQGSTATAYEPYVQPQTVTDIPMLLGVGDTKDEVELINGPKTVRIGLYVITGSEAWTENTTYSGTFYADCLPEQVKYPSLSMFTRYVGVDSSTSVGGLTNGKAKCGTSSFRQRIYIRDVSCADVDALKAKLSGFYADGEPCIVAFVLATETTEQGTPHELHTSEGTNVVDVVSNVDPVDLSVEYASNN